VCDLLVLHRGLVRLPCAERGVGAAPPAHAPSRAPQRGRAAGRLPPVTYGSLAPREPRFPDGGSDATRDGPRRRGQEYRPRPPQRSP